MFKNMKIEINESQNLSDVVGELKRLWFKSVNLGHEDESWDVLVDVEIVAWCQSTSNDDSFELTTLQQIKEMKWPSKKLGRMLRVGRQVIHTKMIFRLFHIGELLITRLSHLVMKMIIGLNIIIVKAFMIT